MLDQENTVQSLTMDQRDNDQSKNAPTTVTITAGKKPSLIVMFIAVTLAMLGLDLALKWYAFQHVADTPVVLSDESPYFGVPHHDPTVLIPNILNLQLTANEGAIFGIGKGSRWVFIVVSLFATGFVGRVFWKSDARMKLFHISLALILAGALGNLYDRMVYAVVRDMLHLFPNWELPFGLTWPGGARGLYPWIFNLADVSLLLGVILVVWITWRHAPQKQAGEKAQD